MARAANSKYRKELVFSRQTIHLSAVCRRASNSRVRRVGRRWRTFQSRITVLYNIPLSEIPSVLSHAKSIVEFLRPSVDIPFSITDFIPLDDSKQQKAYTIEEKRIKYPNAYRPWTKEDDDRLLQLSASGKSITELCEIFGRNQGAITSRLRKLNR